MIAIQDVGKNYLFDQNIDKIGFFDEPVQLPRDSLKFPVLFKEIPNFDWARPQYINDHHIVFGYYGDPAEKEIELISEVPEDFKYLITKHTEQDSLDFWFTGIKEIDSLVFNLSGKDSIEQRIVKPARPKIDSLEFSFSHRGSIDFLDTLALKATLPLVAIDNDFIEIRDIDSLVVPFTSSINSNQNKIIFDFEKTPNDRYAIQLLPNAATDFWGSTNDTLNIILGTKKLEDYGIIILTVETEGTYNYFLQLLDARGDVVRKALKSENNRYTFDYLLPGTYSVRMIKDRNNNRQWDTGNYLKKIQPEEVVYMEGEIDLRANWDQNEIFTVEETNRDR